MKTPMVLLVSALAATAILTACGGGGGGSSGGTAPTLSNLTISPDAAAAGLQIEISGVFTFTDPDGDLDGGAFLYTYGGTTYSIPLPADLAGITGATLSFVLTAILNSDTGTQVIPCWLVDKAGRASNIINVNFNQLWTRQFGTAGEDIGSALAIDGSDRLYVAGESAGDFAGRSNSGGKDVLVAVYNADTTPQWSDLYGGSGEDIAVGIAVGASGNVYVAGHTASASFEGHGTAGATDLFLSRYDPAGSRQWSVVLGSAGAETVHGLARDSADNIYVVGETSGDLDGESNAGGYDGFIAKFNADGVKQWVRLLGTTGVDSVYAIRIDSQDRIYVAGGTNGVLGVDPSPGDPQENYDIFVAEYDMDGAQQWLSQLGTPCSEWATGLAFDSSNNLYLVGKIGFGVTCAFDNNTASGQWDAFLLKTSAAGVGQWVRQFGTSANDFAKAVTVDRNDNIYVTGYLDSTYFNDDNEGHRVFLAKYNTGGTQAWLAQRDGGSSWGDQGRALVTDSNDDIFVAAITQGAYDGHVNIGDDDIVILGFDAGGAVR